MQFIWVTDIWVLLHKIQAFKNSMHGYDRGRYVHANSVTRTPKFVNVVDSSVNKNLNLPIFHTDHYALKK